VHGKWLDRKMENEEFKSIGFRYYSETELLIVLDMEDSVVDFTVSIDGVSITSMMAFPFHFHKEDALHSHQ